MSIQSITPAVGWAAVYEIENSTVAKPLVCWGLVLDDSIGEKFVQGFVVDDNGTIQSASSIKGFKTFEFDLESTTVDYLALEKHD